MGERHFLIAVDDKEAEIPVLKHATKKSTSISGNNKVNLQKRPCEIPLLLETVCHFRRVSLLLYHL